MLAATMAVIRAMMAVTINLTEQHVTDADPCRCPPPHSPPPLATANRKVLDVSLGFAGGVMIAASVWTVLIPAIEASQLDRLPARFPAAGSFSLGIAFLFGLSRLDEALPHFYLGLPHPIALAVLATGFTWAMTAAGAAVVLVVRDISRGVFDGMLGFAGGIMMAASFWSLLLPAIELSEGRGVPPWFPAVAGFLFGAAFLLGIDKILPHLHIGFPMEEREGLKTAWRRTTLLILAITLHNIPEGLAVGVGFGAVAAGSPSADLGAAMILALGIGIQNFPEGLAVSMPLRREGLSPLKSLWYGQLSGAVEPVAAFLGAVAVVISEPILPYALSFAAGAMIFVVVEEVVPESQRGGHTDLATLGTMVGFALMMLLDVAFG